MNLLRNRHLSPRRLRLAASGAVVTLAALALTACSAGGSTQATSTPTPVHTAVSAVTPDTGNTIPAGAITIKGTGLADVKSVKFGTTSVPAKVTSGGDALVVTPPAAPDYQAATVNVTLIGPGNTTLATEKGAYSYTVSTPVAKQLQYALQYWQNYNTAQFGDLNPVGGDCANFVSQTLLARGWQMNDDWYSKDAGTDWSAAWGYVPAMDEYFSDNASSLGLVELNDSQRSQLALGDIAIFDWDNDGSPDHVEVVTSLQTVNGQIKVGLASHNDDFDFRDLDQTITVTHPGASVHFWHLTS